jgi:hypothetical protein
LTFAGPYAIGISRLDEFPPHASGYLCLSVVAAVPASVQGFWSQESWSGLLDFHARDARGVDLVVRDTNLCAWGWNTLGPIALRRGMANYKLMRLLRSVGTIHLDGRISATIPVGVETIRLDGLQAGLVAEGKKARVRVDRLQAFAHPRNRRPAAARPQGVDGRDQGHGFQLTEECDLGHGHPESRLLRRWHDLEAHCGRSQERSAAVIFSMTRFSFRETSVVFRSAK